MAKIRLSRLLGSVIGVLIVVGLVSTAFAQVCSLDDLKTSYPGADKLIQESPYYFVDNGIVYETLTAGEEVPLPLPRIVKDRPVKVAYLTLGPVMQVKRHCHQTLIDVAHRGWEIMYLEATSPMKMREAFEIAINKDVDAAVITYWTMPALKDLIIKARKKGIGVYVVDTELQPGVLLDCTAHQGVGAAKMAYYMLERMGLRGKAGIVAMARELAERERRDVIEALFKVYGVEVVSIENLTNQDTQMEDAYKWAQNMLVKYGDELTWLVGIWDGLGLSCSRAIEQAGLQGKVFSTGMDGGDQIFDMIRENQTLVTCAVQPYEWYTHNTFEAINQIQVEGIPPLAPDSWVKEGRTIFLDQALVTAENIPAEGTSIHQLFEYYQNDPYYLGDDWYNWQDVGGPYLLGTMEELIVYPEQID